jgi:hypothetical protein
MRSKLTFYTLWGLSERPQKIARWGRKFNNLGQVHYGLHLRMFQVYVDDTGDTLT